MGSGRSFLLSCKKTVFSVPGISSICEMKSDWAMGGPMTGVSLR